MCDPLMIDMVREYVLGQGSKQMIDCIHTPSPELELLVEVQDQLGWHHFVEGRISKVFLEVMQPILLESYLFISAERWGQLFVETLLDLTHKQWICRNSKVHFERADGLTENKYLSNFSKVENRMHTPSAELLLKHQHLLETDFESLGAGSTSARQFWIVSMESAISAAKMVYSGRVLPGQMGKVTPADIVLLLLHSLCDSIRLLWMI